MVKKDEYEHQMSNDDILALYLTLEAKKQKESSLYYYLRNIPAESYEYMLVNFPEEYDSFFTSQLRRQKKSLLKQQKAHLGKRVHRLKF